MGTFDRNYALKNDTRGAPLQILTTIGNKIADKNNSMPYYSNIFTNDNHLYIKYAENFKNGYECGLDCYCIFF